MMKQVKKEQIKFGFENMAFGLRDNILRLLYT